jgi:glycine betaine/proline transport system substrate-binding protein
MRGFCELVAASSLLAMLMGSIPTSAAAAGNPTACRHVRMAQPGWTDLTFTSGIADVLLTSLGYEAKTDLLGIAVAYKSLEDGQLDAFLGYWNPAMVKDYAPYEKAGTVESIHVNLVGAKYTFAVPAYVYDVGVHDIGDLHKFAAQFDHKMYGIEPGSNDLMIAIGKDSKFDLADWTVVQSSEQGMLTAVKRAVQHKRFIVFQGWAPHPMNNEFDMRYLTGGDAYYGPNFGGATVSTQVRKGYVAQCTNVGRLLTNLTFTVPLENTGMGYLTNDHMTPAAAAIRTIKSDPELLDSWLSGVTTIDGKDGLTAVRQKLGLAAE